MPRGWTSRTDDGTCVKEMPGGAGGGEAVTISASVGSGGVNRPEDVKRIQEALNRVPPEKGGPVPPLVVDGICGPKTTAAIWRFQNAQGVIADGRIDPGYATLERLNEATGAGGGTGSGRREKVVAFLVEALRTVRAAQATLVMARPLLLSPGAPDTSPGASVRQERLALLERHFLISQQRSPVGTADQILEIYDRMQKCFIRPGGLWGPAIFEEDPRGQPKGSRAVAFTYAGGYDCGGQRYQGLRMDAIYFLPRMDILPDDHLVMTIVHELAHFVGPTVIGTIDDYAYGWVDGVRMRTLSAYWRAFNAETYNNFAFEALYHRVPSR